MEAQEEKARLLVVDDNEMNRDMLARRLRKLGHDVEIAEDGSRALALAAEKDFDLILLDIMMPGLDGYAVLERLKADPRLRDVPVVMVSAVGETESVVRCIDLGADDYLPKPFNPVILRARVGSSLAKKRLHDRERERARALERELEIGREIQAGFLPDELPRVEGWEVAARFRPARQCAGDFFDAFDLRERRLGLVVADVCDKGVGAALFMALFRSLIRSTASLAAEETRAAAEILDRTVRWTNDYIARTHGKANMFATAFLAVADTAGGRLEYVNAGHEAPMIVRAGGGVRERLAPTGPALGMLAEVEFSRRSVELDPGETLLVYTDGVTEAKGDEGFFGEARVIESVAAPAAGAEEILSRIDDALGAHIGANPPYDDVTLLAFRRCPGAGR